jgi:hypothetical protein
MIRLACVLIFLTVIFVRCIVGPSDETFTPSVSSRVATHSDDPTYPVLAEQSNRSIDVNSELQRLRDRQQYPKVIALARIRRAELDQVILQVDGMGLLVQQRDRVLTPMREERNQMQRVIAAASDVR